MKELQKSIRETQLDSFEGLVCKFACQKSGPQNKAEVRALNYLDEAVIACAKK